MSLGEEFDEEREDETRDAERVYRLLETDQLRAVALAFTLDRASLADERALAFCEGRLAIIRRVLMERGAL